MNLSRQQLVGIGLAVFLHLGFAAWWAAGQVATPPKAPLETMTFSLISAETPAAPAPAARPLPVKPQKTITPVPRQPTPAPSRPTEIAQTAAADVAPSAVATASTPVAASGTPTEQAAVTPPRFDAAYLANPPPPYPGLSRRMGEQGRVLLRVRVSAEGLPSNIEIAQSSGFPRLDSAAREAVLGWKFIPACQGDRTVSASVNVPIAFKLN